MVRGIAKRTQTVKAMLRVGYSIVSDLDSDSEKQKSPVAEDSVAEIGIEFDILRGSVSSLIGELEDGEHDDRLEALTACETRSKGRKTALEAIAERAELIAGE